MIRFQRTIIVWLVWTTLVGMERSQSRDSFRVSQVWTGFWPGEKKRAGEEEENNAGQRLLPQHQGANLSTAVWEWCDRRLLKGKAWRAAGAWCMRKELELCWNYLSVEVMFSYTGKASGNGFIQTWQDVQGQSQELVVVPRRNISKLANKWILLDYRLTGFISDKCSNLFYCWSLF